MTVAVIPFYDGNSEEDLNERTSSGAVRWADVEYIRKEHVQVERQDEAPEDEEGELPPELRWYYMAVMRDGSEVRITPRVRHEFEIDALGVRLIHAFDAAVLAQGF